MEDLSDIVAVLPMTGHGLYYETPKYVVIY